MNQLILSGPAARRWALAVLALLSFPAAAQAQSCPAATSPIISNLTTNSATVNFTPAAGAASYTVTVARGSTVEQTLNPTSSPLNLNGLFPSNIYTVNIVTNCTGGGTSSPATVTFTTASSPVSCPAIANLTVSNTTSTTATINFLPTSGASGYTVAYSSVGTPLVQTVITNPPYTLRNLLPGTAYSVRVTSSCNSGAGNPVSTNFTTSQVASATQAQLAGGPVLVFPNPAQQAFVLQLPAQVAAPTARLELLSAQGRVVRKQQLALTSSGTQVPVSLTGLPSGLYLVRVQAGSETATTRLVVE